VQQIVSDAHSYAARWIGAGKTADYIPQLAKADAGLLSVCVTDVEGNSFFAGDSAVRFTMQSICKVVLLITALQDVGFEGVFQKVGMEPTGDPFNSIVRLENVSPHRPHNPMINAGAIAVTSCVKGNSADVRFRRLLDTTRLLVGNPLLEYSEEVYRSELETGDRNRALAYMMRQGGIITGSVSQHLEVYFKACSILVSCREISYLGAVLANNGVCPRTGEALISPGNIKIIRALMCTCGMYDFSGEFALQVGIPSKSGVGGGIMGAVPNRMGVGVYSPALDVHGNSLCGVKAMEYLSRVLELSIF